MVPANKRESAHHSKNLDHICHCSRLCENGRAIHGCCSFRALELKAWIERWKEEKGQCTCRGKELCYFPTIDTAYCTVSIMERIKDHMPHF